MGFAGLRNCNINSFRCLSRRAGTGWEEKSKNKDYVSRRAFKAMSSHYLKAVQGSLKRTDGEGMGETVGLSGSVMYKQRGVSIVRVGCHRGLISYQSGRRVLVVGEERWFNKGGYSGSSYLGNCLVVVVMDGTSFGWGLWCQSINSVNNKNNNRCGGTRTNQQRLVA